METLNDMLTSIHKAQARYARITKDSGERDVNEDTGFQRDVQDNKFKFSSHKEFLSELFLLEQDVDDSTALNTDFDDDGIDADHLIHDLLKNRVGAVLARGASKYGTHNWQRGNNLSRSFDSLFRHIMQWYLGDTSEDHLASAVCNIMFLMVHEYNLHHGIDFNDENGVSLGKHQEFADAGALFMDADRYNINQSANTADGLTTE